MNCWVKWEFSFPLPWVISENTRNRLKIPQHCLDRSEALEKALHMLHHFKCAFKCKKLCWPEGRKQNKNRKGGGISEQFTSLKVKCSSGKVFSLFLPQKRVIFESLCRQSILSLFFIDITFKLLLALLVLTLLQKPDQLLQSQQVTWHQKTPIHLSPFTQVVCRSPS